MGAAEWEDENGGGRVNHGVHVLCIQYPLFNEGHRRSRGSCKTMQSYPPSRSGQRGVRFVVESNGGFLGAGAERVVSCCPIVFAGLAL